MTPGRNGNAAEALGIVEAAQGNTKTEPAEFTSSASRSAIEHASSARILSRAADILARSTYRNARTPEVREVERALVVLLDDAAQLHRSRAISPAREAA